MLLALSGIVLAPLRWLAVGYVVIVPATIVNQGWDRGVHEAQKVNQVFLAYFKPLPSDAEVIRYFNDHRMDIDELVRHYQSGEYATLVKNSTPPPTFIHLPEITMLQTRAGVSSIERTTSGLWLANPYSADTAIKAGQMDLVRSYRYHDLILRLAMPEYSGPSWFHGYVWKGLYYVPVVPKVERGELWLPFRDGGEGSREMVSTSLDSYPASWKRGDCALRQIESQWFIRMCNS